MALIDRFRQWHAALNERRIDRLPSLFTPPLMERDALGHFVVECLRGCDIGPRGGRGCDQPLGMRALAGARTAEKQGQ